jgi:hypothetical protein
LICSAGSAWCSRQDNGASNYGESAGGCPGGAGSSSPAFGSIIVGCFTPQSNLTGTATILELRTASTTPTLYSSLTLDIQFPQGDPTDTLTFGGNFGLIACDNNGSTVPCTPTIPSATVDTISVNDLVIKPGSPDSTTLTIGNALVGLDDSLVLYFTAPAFVTDVTGTVATTTPEPGTLALIGSGILAVGLSFRRRETKSKKA